MQEPSILQTLKDAHTAHQAGDFVNALKFYQHFFDHALDDDPYALYAVRLSHCLEGWAKLANEFPGAKNALMATRSSLLEQYLAQRNPEQFHEYYVISGLLKLKDEALTTFIELHQTQPKSAAKLSKYVWEDLIAAEQWQVCSELMVETNQKMDELFAVFDEASKLKEFDPSFDNPKFEQHIVDTLLNDLQNIVMVLRHSSRNEEAQALQRQFYQGVESRNHSLLSKEVHAKAAFLFSGH
jgi:hypothetical protein